jgi:hypothetical protein
MIYLLGLIRDPEAGVGDATNRKAWINQTFASSRGSHGANLCRKTKLSTTGD